MVRSLRTDPLNGEGQTYLANPHPLGRELQGFTEIIMKRVVQEGIATRGGQIGQGKIQKVP